MFGGSCSLKGGYRIANKRHYLKKSIKKRSKSIKRRSKSLKRRSKGLKRRSKSLKKRGGGYGISRGSWVIKPYKKRGGGSTHKYPEGNH